MVNRRGQFFLLAAVIISAVVISLGFVANKATTNREPGSFYDFSYEVKRETGSVIDYEIYTISEGELEEFVELYASEIRDRDPSSNFLFLYGNSTGMTLRNYGAETAYIENGEVPGSGSTVISSICIGTQCQPVQELAGTFETEGGEVHWNESQLVGQEEVTVTIGDNDYDFPVSEHKQVIFIIQKETEDETFISVE